MNKFERHENYDLFEIGQRIRILYFDLDGSEPCYRDMMIAQGKETKIQCLYNHCVTLEIDAGNWGWSYDWITPIYDCLPEELFEI